MGRFGLLEIYTEVDGLETYTRLASVNRHHDQYIDRKYKEAFSPRGNDLFTWSCSWGLGTESQPC
jgi:hypothetical protein